MTLTYWLLAPYLLCWLAFLAAVVVMRLSGGKKSVLDLNIGTVGFGLLFLGAICTVVMLIMFPYRSATATQWVGFALHFVAAIASLVVASAWLAHHIA